MKRLALVSLLLLSACFPIPVTPIVGAAGVLVQTDQKHTTGQEIETLQSVTLPVSDWKVLKVSAWGTTAANLNAKSVFLYFGSDLPVAVNVEIPVGWWNVDTVIVRKSNTEQSISSSMRVGNLSGDTRTAVHSISGVQDLSAPVVIRGAGKGVLAHDVVQLGLVVEILK